MLFYIPLDNKILFECIPPTNYTSKVPGKKSCNFLFAPAELIQINSTSNLSQIVFKKFEENELDF